MEYTYENKLCLVGCLRYCEDWLKLRRSTMRCFFATPPLLMEEQEEEEEEGLPVSRTLRHMRPKGMVCLRMPAETMRWRRRGAGLVLVEAILLVGVVWLEVEEEEEEPSATLMVFLRMKPFLIMKILPLLLLLLGGGGGVVEAVFLLRGVVRVIFIFNG